MPPRAVFYLPIPQPAKGTMALRRYSNAKLAREIEYSQQWTSRVLNGYENATEKFMGAVADVLDLPIHELFRPGGRHGY